MLIKAFRKHKHIIYGALSSGFETSLVHLPFYMLICWIHIIPVSYESHQSSQYFWNQTINWQKLVCTTHNQSSHLIQKKVSMTRNLMHKFSIKVQNKMVNLNSMKLAKWVRDWLRLCRPLKWPKTETHITLVETEIFAKNMSEIDETLLHTPTIYTGQTKPVSTPHIDRLPKWELNWRNN